ncbi:MAG: exosome complex RNA-binding protein Csl4 [Candidatus Jordarchaeales archaeon]
MTGKKKGSETIFTIPGEKLGVVEEYVPGQGTYESDGAIFSQVVGYATLDSYNKNISIRQLSKRPTVPREGSTVIGVVTQYQERMASVDLFMIDGKVLHPPYGAILHISNSSRRFERVMNDVCRTGDIVKAKVISVKDEPSYYVTEYIISNVSLWAALENALAPTGFRLIESLDLTNGGLSLKVVDPLRFKTTPDRALPYFFARRITSHEADVRTWAGVIYRDRNDFQEKLVWATSSPEILEKYGIPDGSGGRKHKKMVYRTSDRSLVDTESEARELASMILWDLETPSPAVEITLPWLDLGFWPFQLLEVVGENISTLVGVQDIEWSWSWERPCGSTVIRGSEGRVVGARGLWFARDSRRGLNRELQDLEKLSEAARSLQPGKPTVVGAWFQHEDGSPKPVIDIILAEPPTWAKGVLLKIYRFSFLDSGVVSSASGAVITLDGKSYPSGRYKGACRDYLLVSSGILEGTMWRIKTVSGANVTLEKEPKMLPQAGDEVILARLRSLQTKAYPLCRFIRLEDVTEGELIGVSYAWKTR